MLQYYVQSKDYQLSELKKYFQKYFDTEEDVDIFIDSLIKTDQVKKVGNIIRFPPTHARKFLRPKYFRFQSIYYGGGDRTGVRGSYDFVQKYGYPAELYLVSVYKRGRWKRLDERVPLRISRGRLPLTLESWRSSIPRVISEEYDIRPRDYVHVRIDSTVTEYYTLIQIWGFQYDETLTFEYSKNPANSRNLELRGTDFVNEISGNNVVDQLSRNDERIQGLMDSLLFSADREYFEAAHAFDVIVGSEYTPLKEPASKIADVKFTDLDRQTVLLQWRTSSFFDHIPGQNDFVRARSHIKSRRIPGRQWW